MPGSGKGGGRGKVVMSRVWLVVDIVVMCFIIMY